MLNYLPAAISENITLEMKNVPGKFCSLFFYDFKEDFSTSFLEVESEIMTSAGSQYIFLCVEI